MIRKPTYEELKQRIKELEEEVDKHKRAQEELQHARNDECELLEMTSAQTPRSEAKAFQKA